MNEIFGWCIICLAVWRPIYTLHNFCPKPGFLRVVPVVKIESQSFSTAEIQLKIGRVIIYREYVWFKCGLQVKTIIIWPMRKIVTLSLDDCYSMVTTTTIWKPNLKPSWATCLQLGCTTDDRLYQMNHCVSIPMIFVSARLSRQMTCATLTAKMALTAKIRDCSRFMAWITLHLLPKWRPTRAHKKSRTQFWLSDSSGIIYHLWLYCVNQAHNSPTNIQTYMTYL
jgi:hypothetical protein